MRKSLPVLALAVLLGSLGTAWASPVDLELLLMAEVSSDITDEEFDLILDGYSGVFRTPNLGVTLGLGQGLAVALVFWSGPYEQAVAIDWTHLHDPQSVLEFADAIDAITGRPAFADLSTSISGALEWTVLADIFDNEFEGGHRVIDISGEGENDADPPGLDLPEARDRAKGGGGTIGAEVINAIVKFPPEGDAMDQYWDVVGGPGAPGWVYMFESYEFEFPAVLRSKVIGELPYEIIPEPASVTLVLLGAGLLGLRLRQRRR